MATNRRVTEPTNASSDDEESSSDESDTRSASGNEVHSKRVGLCKQALASNLPKIKTKMNKLFGRRRKSPMLANARTGSQSSHKEVNRNDNKPSPTNTRNPKDVSSTSIHSEPERIAHDDKSRIREFATEKLQRLRDLLSVGKKDMSNLALPPSPDVSRFSDPGPGAATRNIHGESSVDSVKKWQEMRISDLTKHVFSRKKTNLKYKSSLDALPEYSDPEETDGKGGAVAEQTDKKWHQVNYDHLKKTLKDWKRNVSKTIESANDHFSIQIDPDQLHDRGHSDNGDQDQTGRNILFGSEKKNTRKGGELKYDVFKLASQFLIEDKRLIVLSGMLVCTLLSICLFLVTYLTSGSTWAGWLAFGMTFCFTMIGYIISQSARCVLLLALPAFCGARGRSVLWCVILGLLVRGPVKNMVSNVGEIARTMGCQAKQLYDQTEEFRKVIKQPFLDFADRMSLGIDRMKAIGRKVEEAKKPIDNVMSDIYEGMKNAKDRMSAFSADCEGSLSSSQMDCKNGIMSGHRDCMKGANAFVKGLEDFGTDVANTFKDIGNFFESLFGKRRKRRSSDISRHSRLRRTTFGDVVCALAKVEGICDIIEFPKLACTIPGELSGVFGFAEKYVNQVEERIREEFDFNLKSSVSNVFQSNMTESLRDMKDNVQQKLGTVMSSIKLFLNIFSKLCTVSVFLVLFKAYMYRRKYLKQLDFDNKYLSAKLEELDEKLVQSGDRPVFPLTAKQRKNYVYTTSKRLTSEEKTFFIKGARVFIVKLVIGGVVFLLDYGLSWYLSILREQGEGAALESVGESVVKFEVVGGNGVMPQALRGLTDSLNGASMAHNKTISMETCFPRPKSTDTSLILLVAYTYIMFIMFILVQAYGLRICHKIMEVFHPHLQQDRLENLHNKLKVEKYGDDI